MKATLEISEEQVQQQLEVQLKKLLEPDNYNNPIKSATDKLFRYDGPLETQIRTKVKELADSIMIDPTWTERFAMALAHELAKRQLDDLIKSKK